MSHEAWRSGDQLPMTTLPAPGRITLDIATEADLPRFRKDLQDAFSTAVVETFGSVDNGPIPPDEDVAASFTAPNAVVHRILEDGRWVGGAVVSIDRRRGTTPSTSFTCMLANSAAGSAAGLGTPSRRITRTR